MELITRMFTLLEDLTWGWANPDFSRGDVYRNLDASLSRIPVAILYNCPAACPELVQQLRDLYPTLPLGRNSRGGQPRALVPVQTGCRVWPR